ncbi:hypothetical protein H8E07_01860 [bacterium]|nr:hypothetical protein [bacterium]
MTGRIYMMFGALAVAIAALGGRLAWVVRDDSHQVDEYAEKDRHRIIVQPGRPGGIPARGHHRYAPLGRSKRAPSCPVGAALADGIDQGLPVWAECGGLMYLSRALIKDGVTHDMVGTLPVRVEQMTKPQGHGYVKALSDRANPVLPEGTELCGHEFHYSRLRDNGNKVPTVLKLSRGVGVGGGRDGLQVGQAIATYTHLHALATPSWAPGLVGAAAGSVQ